MRAVGSWAGEGEEVGIGVWGPWRAVWGCLDVMLEPMRRSFKGVKGMGFKMTEGRSLRGQCFWGSHWGKMTNWLDGR